MTVSSSTSDARRIAGWAVLLGGIAGALLSLAVGDWGRRTLFDAWQVSGPRTIPDDRVAVVLIDSLSLDAVGPWPWPRYYIARLTEEIARQRPRAIGYDMIFAEHDALNPQVFTALYPELAPAAAAQVNALPTMDAVLAEVLGAAPVVLARLGVDGDGGDASALLVDPPVAGTPPRDVPRVRQVLASIPELDDVALGHALINGPPDEDGIVRRVPLTILAGGQAMPGLAVELARLGAGVEQMGWKGRSLALGERALPADSAGRLAIRMGDFPESATFSAAEVIAGKVRPDAFKGKVVLVGQGAEGTSDIVATPLATEIIGVLVQAQAVDAILGRGWLDRPPWIESAEWAAALLLVVLVAFSGRTRRHGFLVAASAIALVLPLASWLAYDRANLLFDPVRPLLIGVAAAGALYATLFLLGRIERARLTAALTEQRVAAAEQEGELKAARRIQLGMVPGPERLAGLDPRVEIGAVLRPARSVGGDFYDALMVGPDKLLFVIGDVTGKGVPAALYMALSKALAKSVLSRGAARLDEAVTGLNRELMAEADDEMGVTMLVGVLDCASGGLTLVSAGHENPLAVRNGGSVETLALRGGPPFCVVDFAYPEETARLATGETLVLITDGATEAQDASQALLGLEGVVSALRGEVAMPAPARATDLADRIRAFEGETEPSDDLTILTLRFRGG